MTRDRAEQELHVRETLLKEAQGHVEERRVETAEAREQLADAQAQLVAARARQLTLEEELCRQRDQLAEENEATKTQRRRIAREFKQQRAAHLAELEQRKAELESLATTSDENLAGEAAALRARLDEMREEHARQLDELRSAQAAVPTPRNCDGSAKSETSSPNGSRRPNRGSATTRGRARAMRAAATTCNAASRWPWKKYAN